MGKFRDFLDNLIFKNVKDGELINVSTFQPSREELGLMIDMYALYSAIEIKAKLLANCEYKTYRGGKEIRGPTWVQLNYKPNVNQSATEFWTELYSKLFYYEEALIFQFEDQWIIADSFEREDYALRETIFRNISRGDFTYGRSLRIGEVFYFTCKSEATRALKEGILQQYNALASSAAEGYKKSGGEKVLLNIPMSAQGDSKFTEKFNDLMNNRFRSFFKEKNAVLPLMNGIQGSFHASGGKGGEIGDIETLIGNALKQAAIAQGISPALLTGEVAGIKEALDWSLTTGIDPAANIVSEEITTKLNSREEIANGNFLVADTTNIKHIDIFDIAGSVDKLISSGFLDIDEARSSAGLQRTGEEWAKKHYLTKNYQPIDKLEELSGGGETNE